MVADRLFARRVGQRLQYGGEKARRAVAAPQRNGAAAGLRVDVDEAPVHLAVRRAIAQRADRGTEGCIGENRSVDQRSVLGRKPRRLSARKHTVEEGVAPRPFYPGGRPPPVQLERKSVL